MQLVINTYGSYLKKEDGCFLLKNEDQKQKISTRNIDSILITSGALVSSDAIQLALERNIEIFFLDDFGDPIGKLWHSKLGRTTFIRRRQLQICETEEGTALIKNLMLQKVENCIKHLHDLASKRGKEKQEFINKTIQNIEITKNKIAEATGLVDDIRNTLMGYEGNVARQYFSALSDLLPERYKFEGRSSRPAKDEFNCLLNYGYGILYSRVEKACIIAGLDPYVGILHTDGYNKKSFVFDMIEPFRIHVDRLVMKLFSAKSVNKSYFDPVHGGMKLNADGKRYFIQHVNEYMEERIRYHKREIRIADIIQHKCHQIANSLVKENEQC